jgi:SAM-dependent methyltransferase
MFAECLGCGSGRVAILLNCGAQPPSNRFVKLGENEQDRYSLRLAQCQDCALIQLQDPMPPAMVKSRFEWLTYNEPEGHLDTLVEHLRSLPGISPASRIVGLSYKDDSTLARFNRLGYPNTFRFDPKADLGIDDSRAGLESTQQVVDEKLMRLLAARHGQVDLLLVRHVLEHAHDPLRFLHAFRPILKSGGHVMFELPDCRKFIAGCDYSFVWEEHVSYFSPQTFSAFASRHGYAVTSLLDYPYPLEHSLVAVLTPDGVPAMNEFLVEEELAAGRRFGQAFLGRKNAIHAYLRRLRHQGQHIAVFGAGHLAAKFINLFDLGEIIECVIDDNPNKQGLRMPGSNLPILGSAVLGEGTIDLCLLSLSPESEQKVLAKMRDYINAGGRFASIFALSPIALELEGPDESAQSE